MKHKKLIVGLVIALTVVVAGAAYLGNSSDLQGRFSRTTRVTRSAVRSVPVTKTISPKIAEQLVAPIAADTKTPVDRTPVDGAPANTVVDVECTDATELTISTQTPASSSAMVYSAQSEVFRFKVDSNACAPTLRTISADFTLSNLSLANFGVASNWEVFEVSGGSIDTNEDKGEASSVSMSGSSGELVFRISNDISNEDALGVAVGDYISGGSRTYAITTLVQEADCGFPCTSSISIRLNSDNWEWSPDKVVSDWDAYTGTKLNASSVNGLPTGYWSQSASK